MNVLTVDVEDYYQVSGFERDIRREDWPNFQSRVVRNTQLILELLANRRIRATFFVLGWVAERFPELVCEIDRAGHEVASHSYWHRLIYTQSPADFRSDLRRSKDVLEGILGKGVAAFRAPSFSITAQSLWALEILIEEGFTMDSSVFPIYHDRCGIPSAPREPFLHESATGSLWEFPATVARFGRVNVPISGGGYFRLLPYWLSAKLLKQQNQLGKPFVFYIHPWELDPDQPRLDAGSRSARFRHRLNLTTTQKKFEALLSQFTFGRLDETLAAYQTSLGACKGVSKQSTIYINAPSTDSCSQILAGSR